MKFDVEIPSLNGIARVEVKTVQEGNVWAAYVAFASERTLDDTCLMLGQTGIPYRFTGLTDKEARENAKNFLQQNYKVARMVW